MPKVKSAAAITEKWQRVAQTRSSDFEAGVKEPGVDWQRATETARPAYEEGIQTAIARNSFGKGVAAAGNTRWQRQTVELGVARWAPGVRAATAAMEAGMERVVKVIETTSLPPRGPRGDPRNMQRAAAMAEALAKARITG